MLEKLTQVKKLAYRPFLDQVLVKKIIHINTYEH